MKMYIILLLVGVADAFSQSTLIDQSYTPANPVFNYYLNYGAEGTLYYLGQEFTPTFSSLNFVDLNIGTRIGSEVALPLGVAIHSDTIDGPILGSSTLIYFGPNSYYTGEARLNFPNPVSLVPGQRYVIEPVTIRGTVGGENISIGVPQAGSGSLYDGGRWIYGLTTLPITYYDNRDMWFREGLIVPEPSTFALAGLALGLGWLGWKWFKRKMS